MGKFFVLTWHPEAKSMCHSLFTTTVEALSKAGHEVRTSDLERMKFNPVSGRHNFVTTANPVFFKQQAEEPFALKNGGVAPEVQAEMDKLAWCDHFVIVFPLWWFALPAVIKGWVDRVFMAGFAYGGGKGLYDSGPFRGKRAMLVLTTGSPAEAYTAEPDAKNGDINGVLRPVHRGIFEFCGFSVLSPEVCYSAAHGTDADRKAFLDKWEARLSGITEETPMKVGRY